MLLGKWASVKAKKAKRLEEIDETKLMGDAGYALSSDSTECRFASQMRNISPDCNPMSRGQCKGGSCVLSEAMNSTASVQVYDRVGTNALRDIWSVS